MTTVSSQRPPAAVAACARALAAAAPDPISAFIHDLGALRAHVQRMRAALPAGVELYYAIKANSEPAILRTLAPWVDGFEVSSGGEIERVAQGAPGRPWVFSGPGKLDSDLRVALERGVELIHLESLGEIRRLGAIAAAAGRRQGVLIRINPNLPRRLGTRLSMAGLPTPFGIDEAQLPEAVALVEQSPGMELRGFHIHAMSHQHDVALHQALLDLYLEAWPAWRALAARPETVGQLNVGGGMGVSYLGGGQFDWAALCRHLELALRRHRHPPRVRFEPGRFVSAFSGYYVMQVLDLKRNHGRSFAVCRGGTHQFRLPAAQAHDHPVMHLPLGRSADPLEAAGAAPARTLTVVGQLCTPKDVLARDVVFQDLRVGDLLLLPLAGAYGLNISHADFLCHPRPGQVFLEPTSAPAPLSIEGSDRHVRARAPHPAHREPDPAAEPGRP
jgi:diaminopimelate decarboxylase